MFFSGLTSPLPKRFAVFQRRNGLLFCSLVLGARLVTGHMRKSTWFILVVFGYYPIVLLTFAFFVEMERGYHFPAVAGTKDEGF